MTRAVRRASRLLTAIPKVYVGPDAVRSRLGERGVLLGAKRPQWVDVLHFDAQSGASMRALVGLRFSAYERWEVVGLSVSASDFRNDRDQLLKELVPGDVLMTEKGPSVHLGDRWKKTTVAR